MQKKRKEEKKEKEGKGAEQEDEEEKEWSKEYLHLFAEWYTMLQLLCEDFCLLGR